MNFERVMAIARKEVYHIWRDPFTLALALLLPLMMVIIFGLAIEFNVKYIDVALYDGDKTQSSRELGDAFGSSNYFLIQPVGSPARAIRMIDAGDVRAALIIEPRFEYHLKSERGASAQIILDGSDNSTIGSILGYINGIQDIAVHKILGMRLIPPVDLKTRFLYNPELNSRWFIVPGLGVVILSILAILLTSLTVAREWENGSMELLLSTPVQPVEIVLGKLSPYVVLGLGAETFIYLFARLGFGVPFLGSYFTLFVGSLFFLCTYLAQGLLISVLTRKQQLAMQIAMMSGMLPSILLSGFIFPVESMPVFFQYFTAILPARWFMVISRDVDLKGAGFRDLVSPFVALVVICFVMIFIASKRFKKDLES